MIIDLRKLSTGSRSLKFELDEDWWNSVGEQDLILGIDTPVQVHIDIYPAGDKYVLDGALSGRIQVLCDRCLESYHRELKTSFRVFLSLPLPQTQEDDMELAEEDLDVDFIRGDEIDLDGIIHEQIYLTIPMKSLCSEDCLGLCPKCGANLNTTDCQCDKEQGHPAFLKLKNLKIEGD
ncbi:MAG: DUF177 domain-containing protein [Deltaproteobacteria bacterium]|nr:DUF177 domain-containing protein [Deltaproteobacteria bacterium]